MGSRKQIIFGGIVMMAFSVLTGCFSSHYTIGKNPKIEEITGVYIGGGGMDLSSQWNYSVRRSVKTDEYTLKKVWWDESEENQKDVKVSISSYEYEWIVETLDGLRYVKYHPSENVMDIGSTVAQINWSGSPSGSYTIDFADKGMGPTISAMSEVFENNAYKANEPIDVTNISYFYFSNGPTDIQNGFRSFTAETNESGGVLLRYKDQGQLEEEAEEMAVDMSVLDSIKQIIVEYGADQWDGFNRDNSSVLDGTAFEMVVLTDNGNAIHASGREMYPEGQIKELVNCT